MIYVFEYGQFFIYESGFVSCYSHFRFNRSSERQYSLRAPDALGDPIVMVDLDTSNGVMFPLYDPDTNLVFLCGKGDSVIRYFEVSGALQTLYLDLSVFTNTNKMHRYVFLVIVQVTPEAPFVHFINTFQSSDPQRGIGMMPKRGCDVNTCEIAKFYRLTNNGLCQIISMTVPRRSELFQEDLYPDTLSDEPANTAEDWIGGTDAEPNLVSLKVSKEDEKNDDNFIVSSSSTAMQSRLSKQCQSFFHHWTFEANQKGIAFEYYRMFVLSLIHISFYVTFN